MSAVVAALEKVGVERLTVCDAQCFSQPAEEDLSSRPGSGARFARLVMLEIVVNDDFLERTVATLEKVARTGPQGCFGDGKIFVLPVIDAIQIDRGERGPQAV